MRALVTELRQESNSLSPVRSGLAFWRETGWVLDADRVRAELGGGASALAGMLAVLDEAGAEVLTGPSMYAQSGGTAEDEVLDAYLDGLLPALRAAGPLDVVLCSFHGALQTVSHDDAEAEVVRRIREVVGEDCIVAASTDLHGYISRPLVERLDILCGYRTYPHTDFVETGRRAATLAVDAVLTGRRPALAWARVPMIVSASAYSTLDGGFAELIADVERRCASGEVRDATVYQMQPWLDVADPHSTVVVIADDPGAARAAAAELADALWAARDGFASRLATIDEVVDLALDPRTPKPVVLVDSADSGNAGAPGDSMAVAERILVRERRPRSATVVADAATAHLAHRLGVGAEARFEIGGAVDPRAVRIDAVGRVRSLHDGEFLPEGVGSAGSVIRIGRSAVIRFGELDVLVCEHIVGNGDPQLYRAFGIEPTLYDLVVVKANTSFRARYRAIAGVICETDTPGAAAPDVASLPFARMPRTIHPWASPEFSATAEVPRP
ncbi:M81 family metallopeptidase [Homoserinibacter sp. YIM 151385]|uniref:M81 family metallopeptidase n=1 Tax=Homoserinibacter sp. YIM 151385 TaxID=2985506 RepID=UPI0022F1176B|nr:M81 family metallopeptidase [Homoserinibacter sp. YIM 151385]WBU37981.1 M81 family metallopeptidase [Homoserinibacter sp. YIM 151385]